MPDQLLIVGGGHCGRASARAAEGVSDADLARGHAPIGLETAADTPAEIAIAILAQLIGVRADRAKAGVAR